MDLRGVLSLSLLCILAGVSAEPQCAVFIPSLLKSGESGKACLVVKHNTEPVDVNVSIEGKGITIPIFNEQVPPGDDFKCSEFQVPKQKNASPVFILVQAVSRDYNYTSRQPVVITPPGNTVLVRSDKYKYMGGQTAHITVFQVNNNLQPMDAMFTTIYVTDPNGNRVKEWKNQNTNGNFLTLEYPFLQDPELGRYQIVVETLSGTTVSQDIVADEYDLPKFSVTLKTPRTITILDKEVLFDFSGQYTYGLSVPGKVSGRVCRPPAYYYAGNPCNRNPDGICVPFTGEISSEGSYKGRVDLLPFQFDRPGDSMSLNVQATLTEQGTGVQMTETKSITITSMLGRARFVDKSMLPSYKKSIPYHVEIMVEDGLGQPQSNQTVELQVDGKVVQNLTSDENGKAQYEIDTSEFGTTQIQLQLIYKTEPQCYDSNWVVPSYSNDYRAISRFFSPTQSFVQLQGPREDLECGATYTIKALYVFGKDALEEETSTTFSYMVMSRAKIVDSGERLVDLTTSRQGEFDLTYTVLPDHVPIVQIVVFNMMKPELVADTAEFSLEKCFKNPVSLNFSSEMGTPGSTVDLQVKATPDSACIARVFDSSLLFMDQGQPLTPDRVYGALQYMSLNGYNHEGYSVYPPQPACVKADEQIVHNHMYYQPVSFPQEPDPSKLFQAMGLFAITNTSFQQAQLCSQPFIQPPVFGRPSFDRVMAFAENADFSMSSTATVPASVGSGAPEIVSLRTYFPEMWYIKPVPVDGTGSAVQPLVVPGTITTWKGDLICVSNKTGFGMTKDLANFTSFQMMFVDVSIPNSIVRGETMVLIGTVANYMDKCMKVQVTLDPSNYYTAEAVGGLPVKCICSKERVSYSWTVNATSLGVLNVTITAQTVHIGDSCEGTADPDEPNRKDIIVRSFTVEAEGVKQDVTQTNFVCVKDENSEVVVNINPSGNLVPGSLKATLQVMGDLLGPALVKPEALFNEPTGCGEQNLATLMPIPLTMGYLNSTGGLTEEMRAKGVQNMAIGYAGQMRYRLGDGSFSAFGQRDSGSAWLTLETLITLDACKPYIMVEDRVMQQGALYLANLQDLTTGSFKPTGTLFNRGLKGGADDDIGFTCAVVIHLLKIYDSTQTPVRLALAYLEAASHKEQSLYNMIMLMNVFKVAGNVERANAMSEMVKALAIDDGTIHWENPLKPQQQASYLFSPPVPSGDLEMTAFALIGFIYGQTPSTISEEIRNDVVKVLLWLVKQQTIRGSYRTTSDTVAVLKALTVAAPFIFMKNATNTVQLKKESQLIREFIIDPSNRFLLNTEQLSSLPGEYKLAVSGNGCVLLQTGVEFNVQYNPTNPAFLLSLTTSPKDCKNGVAYKFDIQVNASYQGIQNTSNMVIIDIPFMSGHIMEYSSLTKLRAQFSKVETKNNHLIIYLAKMDREAEVSFSITMEMSAMVSNFQEKTGKIYDYYERDESGAAVLRHPCTMHPANVKI